MFTIGMRLLRGVLFAHNIRSGNRKQLKKVAQRKSKKFGVGMQVIKVSDPILVKRFKNKGNESLCRDTIQEIRHADALAVWVLLMSMPPSWVVRKKWVNKTLKIGGTRYKNARRRLVELGLWKVERIRSKNGQMGGSRIIISSEMGVTPKGMVPRPQVFQGGRELDASETNTTYESKQSKGQIALNPAPLVNTKNEQNNSVNNK